MTTIKKLFALSCNRCAFPGCDERLTDPQWNGVRADIAHIRGAKPGAARYAPEMTDEERHAPENLVLLCPNHHREIDQLRPQDWSADRLLEIKASHEHGCENRDWAADQLLDFYSSMLLSADSPSAISSPAAPRLVVRDGPKDTFVVVNVGESDAFDVSVEDATGDEGGGVLRLEESPLRRLSPGGEWRAGLHMQTFGSAGQSVVRVRWHSDDGNAFDAEFPLS
ncbi:MAG: HNH endonuclease signature motif containing protein [Acidimicrobiales bacterium]